MPARTMLQSWRFKVREAEEAFKQGRLEKTSRLICAGDLQQYMPGQRLAAKVAKKLIDRAHQYVTAGDTETAWLDFDAACAVGAESDEFVQVRHALVDRTLGEVERLLGTDHFERAMQQLDDLTNRRISDVRIREYKEVAQRLDAAKRLSRQGKFTEADQELASAAAISPEFSIVDDRRQACREKQEESVRLTDELQQALNNDDWTKSLEIAGQLLEISPESRLALDTRKRARGMVGVQSSKTEVLPETQYWVPAKEPREDKSSTSMTSSIGADTVIMRRMEPRFLLWVDAVGGFMVCLGDEVIIGQAAPDTQVDIPILGDVSREHAKLRRQGEDYMIEPIASIRVAGKQIDGTTLLSDGDEIELGHGVIMHFRKPHPLSASARLEFTSRHRTQPWADGVLLMAESCVLGPNWNNHVVCRDWTDDVVLYRDESGLCCRGMEMLEIDGNSCDGGGSLTYNSRVSGEDFSLSLEEI